VQSAYLPYDIPWAISGFLRHFHPRIGILMETELWPNLVHACHHTGTPLAMVNARLSARSARATAASAAWPARPSPTCRRSAPRPRPTASA
jgi:3-deoxy-D-manno-octulosonic-acid transferase